MFKEKMYKKALELYAGRHVVDFVEQLDGKVGLGGFKVQLTSYAQNLFSFGADLDQIQPDVWFEFLQSYLDRSCEAVLDQNGTLDQIDGDAVLAFWGAPVAQQDHAVRAVRTALDITRAWKNLLRETAHAELEKLTLSIGIDTGAAIVGNFGSKYRYRYTAIGDSVHLTALIHKIAPIFGVQILMSEDTRLNIMGHVLSRELDKIRLFEPEQVLHVYEPLAELSEVTPDLQTLVDDFSAGIACYRKRQWDEASDYFFKILKTHPNDRPSRLYIERCTRFKKNPPGADWDGSTQLDFPPNE